VLVGELERKLRRRFAGKSFASVLRDLGVALEAEAGGGAIDLRKSYRRALRTFHPDRATQRQLPWQKVVEAEEVYKLLQTLYDEHVSGLGEARGVARGRAERAHRGRKTWK
jgi:DnaJ-class molecular chaperone